MEKRKKALVLYSGGLDSRLVVKILKEKGFEVEALHFNLPFGCGCCNLNCNFNFTQVEGVKMTIINCSRGYLLREYLEIINHPKHGFGRGINPCKDCKIFMFRKAKKYADENKIKVIASGEVLGQRPMSQTSQAFKIIDKEIGFKILRPLCDLGIEGRQRKKQIALAKKYKIKYPESAGGCLLCEKALSKRLKFLIEMDLIDEKNLVLANIGRHFFISKKNLGWFVIGRNEGENDILETFDNVVLSEKGKPAVFYHLKTNEHEKKARELQKVYQVRNIDKIKKLEGFKL